MSVFLERTDPYHLSLVEEFVKVVTLVKAPHPWVTEVMAKYAPIKRPSISTPACSHGRHVINNCPQDNISSGTLTFGRDPKSNQIHEPQLISTLLVANNGVPDDEESLDRQALTGNEGNSGTAIIDPFPLRAKLFIQMRFAAVEPTDVVMAAESLHRYRLFGLHPPRKPNHIKALKAPFPDMPFIASGGVDQVTASGFIRAGAIALGIRGQLIPPEAIQRRDENWIHELAGRFLAIVQRARAEHGIA